MDVFGRVSVEWNVIKDVITDLQCKGMCVYQHDADKDVSRTHVHFYIEDCQVTIECIKKRIRKVCPSITKSDWAFNTKDVNRSCITYMSKGELDPVFNSLDDLDTDEYKQLWEDKKPAGRMYQTKLQYVTRETASEAKKRKNDLIKEMIIELNDAKYTSNLAHHVETNTIRVIVKVLNDNNVIFGRYTVRDYYDTICARRDPESFVKAIENLCCHKT